MRMPRPTLLLAALGVNLWATVVLVPTLYGVAPIFARVLSPVPLFVLVSACLRPRDELLFGAFPGAIAICAAAQPDASLLLAPAPALLLSGAALLGYLFGAAWVAAQRAFPTDSSLKPLEPAATQPPAEARVPWVWTAFAVCGPAALLHAALLRKGAAADLARAYPDRPAAGALVVCAAAALWVGLVAVYATTGLHARASQKRMQHELRALRTQARKSRAGLSFYLAVVAALAGMAALVYLRYR
ncbi:MAG TPA: hypothetical protein VKN99_26205 [Polyangia bacterium]|nr:hypothetical protein [Polyangia bacterium]